MQVLFVLLNFAVYLLMTAQAAPQIVPECNAAETRALIRSAVEQKLILVGVLPPPEMFQMLEELKDATSPQTDAVVTQFRDALSGHIIKACEVNDAKMGAPLFITIFFSGFGIPQPSAYVLNFGVPGLSASIGRPPEE